MQQASKGSDLLHRSLLLRSWRTISGILYGSPESQREKVVSLDVSVIASDVHEFTELLRCADRLVGVAAIDALEAAGQSLQGRLAGRTGCTLMLGP